jgi:hypothetical protein
VNRRKVNRRAIGSGAWSTRGLRGGVWASRGQDARAATPDYAMPGGRSMVTGCRVLLLVKGVA